MSKEEARAELARLWDAYIEWQRNNDRERMVVGRQREAQEREAWARLWAGNQNQQQSGKKSHPIETER